MAVVKVVIMVVLVVMSFGSGRGISSYVLAEIYILVIVD